MESTMTGTPRRRVRIPHALALLCAGALASCSGHREDLARIGDHTITVADFTDIATRAASRYNGVPDSAKTLLLQDLVKRALLIEAAKARGLDRDPLTIRKRRDIESDVISAALLERLAPREVPVSDAEARQWYDWRNTETHAQLIYTTDRDHADGAMAALAHGAEFGAVADQYNPSGMIPPRGDLGWMAPGSLVPPLDRTLREGPIGKVLGPLQAPGEGWFILRIAGRRPHPQPPWDQQHLPLLEMVRQRKQRLVSVRAFQKLRDDHHVTVDPDGPHLLFARFNSPLLLGGRDSLPPPTAREKAQVLGTYEDERARRQNFTLGEALDDLEQGRGGEKPNLTMLPSFQQWIESRLVQKSIEAEARRRHLAEEPEIAKQIENRLDEYLLDAMYQGQVVEAARATDEDLRKAYEHESHYFAKLASATLQTLTLPDSIAAASTLEHVRSASSIREGILLSSVQVRDQTISFPARDRPWNTLEARIHAMPIGAYGGPVQGPSGWVIFQIASKNETVPPLESLAPDMQQGLRSEAQAFAVERRLTQVTDSLRRVIPVHIEAARLAAVPWPSAMPMLQLGQGPP
jgi:parvulin-like peptidyl-prolyl isomerase